MTAPASPLDGSALMTTQSRVSHPIYSFLSTEIDGFDSLAELALDARWSWDHSTDDVCKRLDPSL
jgi:starch phosphorylase